MEDYCTMCNVRPIGKGNRFLCTRCHQGPAKYLEEQDFFNDRSDTRNQTSDDKRRKSAIVGALMKAWMREDDFEFFQRPSVTIYSSEDEADVRERYNLKGEDTVIAGLTQEELTVLAEGGAYV